MAKVNKRFKDLKGFSDVVDTMIKGLRREWVEVSIDTFGAEHVTEEGKVICVGCAATNALCELMQEPFTRDSIYTAGRSKKFNEGITKEQLAAFEACVDYIRRGDLNYMICAIGHLHVIQDLLPFTVEKEELRRVLFVFFKEHTLPTIFTHNYLECLPAFEKFRDYLKENRL